jgi:hypothetical protein
MLFAKSSDRPFDEPQLLRWFAPRPHDGTLRATHVSIADAGSAALLGSQPTWMWGLEHGINEHGVAIGNEKIWTVDDPHAVPAALIGMDLVRLGLERGSSADAAVDAIVELLEAHGQGGSGEEHHDEPYWSSFLVVDAHGGWVLETSGRTWVAQPVAEGAAVSNRVTLSTGWTRSSSDVPAASDWDDWRAPDAPTGIADHRLRATRTCVTRGSSATARDAAATLRDHGTGAWGAPGSTSSVVPPPQDVHDDWSGVTVCMHIRDYQCTTASIIAELSEDPDTSPRVWASLGTPCTAVLLPVAMFAEAKEAVVPAVLGDEAAWKAFAALGRRVEAPGEAGLHALEAIRSVLGPIEAQAWDEADGLWSSHAAPSAWRVAADRWDQDTRAALAALPE